MKLGVSGKLEEDSGGMDMIRIYCIYMKFSKNINFFLYSTQYKALKILITKLSKL